MKQLIIPIAIIVALIAFFVIIDRKEFSRHDDVQTVQNESPTTKRKPVVSVLETTPISEEKPAADSKTVETKPVIETKPVAETKPVETKLLAETKLAETKLVAETKTAETKPAETKPVAEEKLVPAAIPVLTPEEATALIARMEKEQEEARKRGFVFYEEFFLSAKNIPSITNIQQTPNWQFVPKDNEPIATSSAKKQGYFVVNSDMPLEYSFIEPLLEHTIYRYSICCSVKGEGKIVLSRKDGKTPKEFFVNSKLFEPIVYELGDGNTLNTKITPTVAFSGSLEVESITIYQKPIKDQWTVCLGTIENISSVPDIKKSNYPDCYYTAEFVVKDILDGKPAPQKIQLLIPAFLNNKVDPLSKTMKKGNWKVSIRPFSLASKEEQEIEQVDEIETYLYTPYILNAATTANIPELTVSGIPILEGETYVSPFDNPVNPPLSAKFVEDSKNEIKNELAKTKRIIELVDNEDRINEEFQIAWNEKQEQYDSLNSTIIWAKEQNSFFALPKKWKFVPSTRITEENVDAIFELNRLFESNGIQFIIQIVPDYRDIAALVLNPSFQKYGDQRSARAAKQLLERGIEVHYISDEIVKNAFKYERLFFYPLDYHPDEGTTDIMTSLIAKRLQMFEGVISIDLNPSSFSKEFRNTGYGESLKWPANVDIGSHSAEATVQVPYVLYNQKILASNPESKVLVFGNSFITEPMVSNAYISYLATKILHVCTCNAMSGISALTALPQLFLSNPDKYLKNKKVAVLPISITHLTDNRYIISNIRKNDVYLKNQNKSAFITSLPIKHDVNKIYPTSFEFSNSYILSYLPFRTSCLALVGSDSKAVFTIPNGIVAKKARVSIQPLHDYGVSVKINKKRFSLPSQAVPKWEFIECDIDGKENSISIELDIENCSSSDAKVLIGNVSLFE